MDEAGVAPWHTRGCCHPCRPQEPCARSLFPRRQCGALFPLLPPCRVLREPLWWHSAPLSETQHCLPSVCPPPGPSTRLLSLRCAQLGKSTMDARQPAPLPPFQRPPDRHMIHNPNHQPPTQSYASYGPPNSQPQQPLHVPLAQDPYAASRRDPFRPAGSQHVRNGSRGIHGGEAVPQAQGERQDGWAHTGTGYILVVDSNAPFAQHVCRRRTGRF
jgi:hypothetical protein